MSTTINFCFPLEIGGKLIAEIEGSADVDCDGDLDIAFDVVGETAPVSVTQDDSLGRAIEYAVDSWLHTHMAEQIAEARARATAGRRAYFREQARHDAA